MIISNEKNILECKKVISPYSLNAVALQAGIEALDDDEYIKEIKTKNIEAREELIRGLREYGYNPYPSEANFILCDFGSAANAVYEKLLSKGIKVRCFTNSQTLQNCLRITVPKKEDVVRILEVLEPKDMLVFDLDGVVFDVSNSYRLAIKKTFEYFCEGKLKDSEIQQAKELGGLNCDWDLTQYLLRKYGVNVEYEKIKEIFQQIFFNPQNEDSKGLIDNEKLLLKPEIFERLSKEFDFAVFTGRPRAEAIYSLQKFGILKYFTKIVSQDDVQRQKPHPEGLNLIKKSTNYKKIFYFGDTIDDIKAGNLAQVSTFGVVAPGAKNKKSLLDAGAFDVIDDISKIEKTLLKEFEKC